MGLEGVDLTNLDQFADGGAGVANVGLRERIVLKPALTRRTLRFTVE